MWNLEGERVKATYLGDIPVIGTVRLSRVKYGGGVSHHIILEEGFEAYANIRRKAGDGVLVDHEEIVQCLGSV